MILIELIPKTFWLVCRFFVWIFTARDCEHCEYGCNRCIAMDCSKDYETSEECLNTIHRKHFKRGRWF